MTHPLSGPSTTGRPFFAAFLPPFYCLFPQKPGFPPKIHTIFIFYYNFVKEFLYPNC